MRQISEKDRKILRDLAKKQYEMSQGEKMDALRKEWVAHNDCQSSRPMIVVELGTFAQDIIPPLMQCEGEDARAIEWALHSNMANHELFQDDSVVKDYFPVYTPTFWRPFDIEVKIDHAKNPNSVGHHFVEVLHDLHEDFHLLKPSAFGADLEKLRTDLEFYGELFDGVLPVKVSADALYAVPTQNIVHIMSMENMLFSIYDYPDEFKQMMDQLSDDYLKYFQFLADNHLILPTVEDGGLGQGTYCYTNKLPGWDEFEKRPFTSKDVWGFLDSQETAGISPEMFEEFIFPYYKKIGDQYGRLSYGCCEAVDPIWENCLSKLSTLHRISISPWCNEEYMGEQLRGRDIVYHRKPSPNYLGVGTTLDEEALRAHIDKTLAAAKGCTVEFTQRDVYQINSTYEKVRRYVQIIREECESHPL